MWLTDSFYMFVCFKFDWNCRKTWLKNYDTAFKWHTNLKLGHSRGADKSLARSNWKNNWKVDIFRPTRRSLLPRRPGWKDNVLNFFWVACKSSSLVAVACFLPGRAKDLSAPQYFHECGIKRGKVCTKAEGENLKTTDTEGEFRALT